ncbi:hypothetical protein D3C85_1605580 [compost metagenome]
MNRPALRRILQRIGNEIAQHLINLIAVKPGARHILADSGADVNTLLADLKGEAVSHILQHFRDIRLLNAQAGFLRIQA